MSVKVMSWVWEHSRSKAVQRLVLLAIADCANDAGRDAYPSTATLAKKTALSERGIRKAMSELVELGELVIEYKTGPRGCNRLQIIMRDPAHDAGYPACGATSDPEPSARYPEQGATSYPARGARNPAPHSADPARGAADPARGAPEPSRTIREPSLEPKNTPSPPKPRRPPGTDDPEFEKFWNSYPRKVDKGHARQAWAAAIKNGAKAETLTAAAEQFAAQCAREHTEQRYIAHPTTWLRGERWADQPTNSHNNSRAENRPSNYFRSSRSTNPFADEETR